MEEDAESKFLRAMQESAAGGGSEQDSLKLTEPAEEDASIMTPAHADADAPRVPLGDKHSATISFSSDESDESEAIPGMAAKATDQIQPEVNGNGANGALSSVSPSSISVPQLDGTSDVPISRTVPSASPAAIAAPGVSSNDSEMNTGADGEYTPQPTEAEVIASLRPALRTNHAVKARLPQDRVGMLEDRIQLDPKGDIEAWLALLAEHRNKNKLEEARKTYDRFFKVFPTAVSIPFVDYCANK
jgi:cleavage stimulation factor subunit 3